MLLQYGDRSGDLGDNLLHFPIFPLYTAYYLKYTIEDDGDIKDGEDVKKVHFFLHHLT